LEKSGFEYSAKEVFEYSNTYEYATSCLINKIKLDYKLRPLPNEAILTAISDNS